VNYRPRAVIIASGARLRQLGVPGENELAGRGVSYCDWCDGGLYRGQQVAVVGGGCAAVQAALHLAELCDSVAIVARGSSLRARRDYVLRAADSDRITFHWESVVESVLGQHAVEGLRLRNVADDSRFDLPCTGAFIFAGLVPNSTFVDSAIDRDGQGFIVTDAGYRTSIRSVFAVGAVRSGSHGAVLTAMGEAAAAAATAVEQLDREAMS
jgi:thioredoxin reductase (NADPH)